MTELDKEIIRGIADHNMKIHAAAKALYLHRNTVLYHIERIKQKTGLNAMVFRDLVKLMERIEGEA